MLLIKNLPAKARFDKRHRFDPWVGNIPLEEGVATSEFFPGESHGQRNPKSIWLQKAGHDCSILAQYNTYVQQNTYIYK